MNFPGPLPDERGMKKWVEKLVEQFDFEWDKDGKPRQRNGGGGSGSSVPDGITD